MLVTVGKEKQPRRIDIELLEESAPATVANFKDLISRRYYDGMGFHRIFPRTLVQTGDPKSRHGETDRSGTGGPGYTIPAEIRLKTDQGAVAMARLPDSINPTRASNGSQFFVCIRTMPQFNGQYTVFGKVVQGLDQLDQISSLPVNSNDYPGEGRHPVDPAPVRLAPGKSRRPLGKGPLRLGRVAFPYLRNRMVKG